jgi:hypothetical protein
MPAAAAGIGGLGVGAMPAARQAVRNLPRLRTRGVRFAQPADRGKTGYGTA